MSGPTVVTLLYILALVGGWLIGHAGRNGDDQ